MFIADVEFGVVFVALFQLLEHRRPDTHVDHHGHKQSQHRVPLHHPGSANGGHTWEYGSSDMPLGDRDLEHSVC
jgi:hypothetical protein